jgi:multiple sugar transport system substrate-binding protein
MLTRRQTIGLAAAIGATAMRARAVRAETIALRVVHDYPAVMGPIHQAVAARLRLVRPDVSVTLQAAADYAEVQQIVLRGAITDDLPDVAFHGHSNLPVLVERGVLRPLDPFIAGEGGWEQSFPPAMQAVGRVAGRTYAVPFTLSVPVVYFNAALTRAAGADPEALPRTWPEITALGGRIAAPSGGIFFTTNSQGSWTFMALIQSLGGAILTPDGRDIAFDSAAGLEALEIIAAIGRARGGEDLTQAQARASFSAGALGIMVDSSNRIAINQSELAAAGAALRAAAFPLKPGVDAKLPPSGASATISARDPARQAAAWDYIKVALGPEIQSLMLERSGFLPANAIAVRGEAMARAFAANPNFRAAADRLPDLTFWTAFPGEQALRIHRVIADQLQALVTLQIAPRAALAVIARETRALLPR